MYDHMTMEELHHKLYDGSSTVMHDLDEVRAIIECTGTQACLTPLDEQVSNVMINVATLDWSWDMLHDSISLFGEDYICDMVLEQLDMLVDSHLPRS